MRKVQSIEGRGLIVALRVLQEYGGTLQAGHNGRRAWSPREEDRLYYLGRWQDEITSIDYYLLVHEDKGEVYLACVHIDKSTMVLNTFGDYFVPRWMKEQLTGTP